MRNGPDSRQQLPGELAGAIVAVLRAPSSTHVVDVALSLHAAGIRCLEVSLTTPDALALIAELTSRLDDIAAVGAGTVLTVDDLEAARAAGAAFTLSPSLDLRVVRRSLELGIPHIPGASTPTEVLTAWDEGAPAVKLFPASNLGGPAYLRAIREPLPDVKLVPTGGIEAGEVAAYVAAGAVAVGIGSPMLGSSLVDGPDAALADRVRHFVSALNAAERVAS